MAGVSRYPELGGWSCLVTAEGLAAASSQLFEECDSVEVKHLQDVGDTYAMTTVKLGHALRALEAP